MMEAGITHRILNNFRKIKEVTSSSDFVPVDIQETLFPFGILISGIILAGFILILELILYRRSIRKICKFEKNHFDYFI